MNEFRTLLMILILSSGTFLVGCGRADGPTVIEPTETYELTDQERQNRERSKKMLADQRQR